VVGPDRHESGGLKYMAEIADGGAYEGRHDWATPNPATPRFKGRGPIRSPAGTTTPRSQWPTAAAWCRRDLLSSTNPNS
jgi:hypothetical protein